MVTASVNMRSIIYLLVLLQVRNSLSLRCTFNKHWSTCRPDCSRHNDRVSINCGNTGLSCCPKATLAEVNAYKYPQDCGLTPWGNFGSVVGGRDIEPGVFSWMASLEYANKPNDTGMCAGSVVNFRYVLTAAHCVVGLLIDIYYGPV